MNDTDTIQPNRRILIVDDSEAIHNDLRKVLSNGTTRDDSLREDEALLFGETSLTGTNFEVDSAFQGQEALVLLKQSLAAGNPYAMAFVDIRMPPGWDGVETIAHLWEADADLQVVICTAYSDYSWEKMVRRLGYSDNLIILKKPFDNIEVLQLAHALTRKWLVTRQARIRMEDLDRMVVQRTAELIATNEQLRVSEERFSKAFSASPIAMALQDIENGRFLDVNARFLEITGMTRESAIRRTPEELRLFVGTRKGVPAGPPGGDAVVREHACKFRNQEGEIREALATTEVLRLGQGAQRLLILQDITDKVRLEQRLRQSQKMEAVGKLAGGIAHNFNNLHTVIQGNVELCQYQTQDAQLLANLKAVASASKRAVSLTRQLLAFSRRQMLQPRVLQLRPFLERLKPDLARILGPSIELAIRLELRIPDVLVDADSLEWILQSLCTNARDAMPAGGSWTLSTELAPVGTRDPSMDGFVTNDLYVCISATDTGMGMVPTVMDRVFEPFFTTKDVGQGDGLGLASAYGIVKQQQGWMEVSSHPGQGSTFRVFLLAVSPLRWG